MKESIPNLVIPLLVCSLLIRSALAEAISTASTYQGQLQQNGVPVNHTPDFASTGANQMLIRASGGVGIETENPAEQLSVRAVVESALGGFKFPDGADSPAGQLALGSYQGGTGISWVESCNKQLVLGGRFNTGAGHSAVFITVLGSLSCL